MVDNKLLLVLVPLIVTVAGNITSIVSAIDPALSVIIPLGASSPDSGNGFFPNTLPVKAGDTVTWTNDDTSLHTVTSGLPGDYYPGTEFDSSSLAPGTTFQHTFAIGGPFNYYCILHPYMTGNIVVS
jgi:plastocyanin